MKIKVALKYCGSCNPQMDITKVGRCLAEIVAQRADFELVPLSAIDIDVVVIICGCPRACGNKDEVRARGKQYLLINDERLSGITTLEANLLETIKS